ncbi:uncharacterized protein METZ01_LOCUS68447 [marine metagenome]|uniref:BIG2 domain-containing protein n=1 Tax=marine metagenome TaxID=408172 RepID=A0A381TNG6_9ZZZZ
MKIIKPIILLFIITFSFELYSQESSRIVSNIQDLVLDVDESFVASSVTMDDNDNEVSCNNMIYYSRNREALDVDNETGEITANLPGFYTIVAICIQEGGNRLRKDFSVKVNYPPVNEIKISLIDNVLYTDSYIPLIFEVIDEKGFVRNDVKFNLTSSNNLISIDNLNNVKAITSGKSTLTAEFEGITSSIVLNIKKNPVSYIELKSNSDEARTGDVFQFRAVAYDKKNVVIGDAPIKFSFTGKSFDKSNTASGLIEKDGRFVGDVAGQYIITSNVGNISTSKIVNVIDRNIKRKFKSIGVGTVNDKHTSDFWVFEGVDGRDYAVSGTWGADGTTYFWDVTNPSNLIKIDSVQVDARTVNDVKVSEDGKICVISREGASNRKNGIIIIDVTNPYDVNIISEYTQNLTGGVHNVFIYENHVYALSNGEKYYVINIDDPKNPKEIGKFELGKPGQSIHDVWIEDGIAYSSNWRNGVYLVDVGNGIANGSPSNPVAFANYNYASGAHHATFPYKSKSTGKFYTVLGDEIFPNGIDVKGQNVTAGFLHFVDFTDLDNPVEVARYELPGDGSHNYWIDGDVLYVAMYTGGVRVVDLSGDLMGDLYKQGREIGYILSGSENAYVPNSTMSWGAQLYKGHVFYSDWNSGIGSAKLEPIKPDKTKASIN